MQQNQHIAELGPLLEWLGLRHVVIAPGSRNAPLIQLFTSEPSFQCHSIVDERAAAYVAMGMAKALREPVAVVTTSGTAVMNLAPAVAEAFCQQLPLLVLTADRPPEPIRQFNNQRIDQLAPFYNHTKGFFEMPMEPRSEEEVIRALTAVGQLMRESTIFPGGPVHINVPLLEPLYESLPGPLFTEQIRRTIPDTRPVPSYSAPPEMHTDKKILVLAGMETYEPASISLLTAWCQHPRRAVVAENLANMAGEIFVGNPELVLAGASEDELVELMPDLVIGLGGQLVSKRLKNFLQYAPNVQTFQPQGDPSLWIREAMSGVEKKSDMEENTYMQAWQRVASRQMEKTHRALEEAPFSNLTAASVILRQAPPHTVVHLGNSAAVRYAQVEPVRSDLEYYANRGTSGIDGSVSTAAGAAMVSDRLHLLVVGDLSFVYDSNGLWNRHFPRNLRMVVINDGGGGIFRLLDGPDRMPFFEEFSVTHHPVSIELLTQAFGHGFQRASDREELMTALETLFQPESPVTVLEVDTTGSENSRIFTSFFKKIQ